MKHAIKFLALSLTFVCSGLAQAVVVTFDDLIPDQEILSIEYGTIQDGYHGLNWDNFGFLDSSSADILDNSGYENGTVSGNNVAYNEWANASSTDGSLFDFNGAYLTGAWRDGLIIEVSGFVNDILTYVETVIVDSTSATWFDFDFLGIDSLTFSSSGGVDAPGLSGSGAHFAMDNFTFNEVSDVPLPAAVWLFGAGLCFFVGLRRRKQQA